MRRVVGNNCHPVLRILNARGKRKEAGPSISGKALKTFDENGDVKRWVINLAMVFRMDWISKG